MLPHYRSGLLKFGIEGLIDDPGFFLSPRRLPEPRCEHFENRLETLKPRRISLIFASAYLSNPAQPATSTG